MTDTIWKDGIPDTYSYNRYGSPATDGLEILIERDFAGSWEFDIICVWRDTATGELFGAADSGCSCPTPFSDLTREGMRRIRSVKDLEQLASAGDTAISDDDAAWADIKAAVHRALRTDTSGK